MERQGSYLGREGRRDGRGARDGRGGGIGGRPIPISCARVPPCQASEDAKYDAHGAKGPVGYDEDTFHNDATHNDATCNDFALKRLGSTVVTSCLNLVPFFGVLGGAVLLGEPLSWMKCLGGLLALTGVYLVTIQDATAKDLSPGMVAEGMTSARCQTGPGCAGE
ncbi:MAG: DMT family transporter [Bacillota bacterium]|nr:DMT family transporter [Bacillota bacterium]